MPFRALPKLIHKLELRSVLILIVGGCPFGPHDLGFAADEDIVLILIVGGCPFGHEGWEVLEFKTRDGLNPYCRWMPFRAKIWLVSAAIYCVLILIVGGCPFGPEYEDTSNYDYFKS